MTPRLFCMHPKNLPRYQPNPGNNFRYLEHVLWTTVRGERDQLRPQQDLCRFWKLGRLSTRVNKEKNSSSLFNESHKHDKLEN